MATPQQSSARFRPATDFPKTIAQLPPVEAEQLYTEMRDCLIFTNRSRAQLVRRNEEHKQKTLQLRANVAQMQQLINQLELDKQQLAVKNQQVVAELSQQVQIMSGHFDQLTAAYDAIADIDNPVGFMAQPNRFFRFIQALKAIILFWRDEKEPLLGEPPSQVLPDHTNRTNPYGTDADRRENPQMYQDPASINRSLLDD
ncbi:MAG: hypothetical protein EDM05_038455 [Leptolyngbya sp. IPPAS B-1204]|nr:hypothetical protein [Elainella sp. C42_A2020_010]RNJ66274.1 MAG: hypothetical protein EDM05_26765 [Leptolyngbya sp. IPPAS B-1204]